MRFQLSPFPRIIVFSEAHDKINDSAPATGFCSLAMLCLMVSLGTLITFILFQEVASTIANAARLSLIFFVLVCAGMSLIGLQGRAKNGLILVLAMQALTQCTSILDFLER